MALNQEELETLAVLLKKIDNTQIRGEVWHALVQKFPTIPVELLIFDKNNRVFLVYRKDQEFDGYHNPGSVLNDWETIPERRQKLVENEIIKDAGITITEPKAIGWMGIYRGTGPYDNTSRNGCCLIHIAYLTSDFTPKEGMGFFPLDELPKNILPCRIPMLRRVEQYLKDPIPLHD